tara:strand:+ start:966 stop:1364 length:399 start_codon:yes stop_codon:yes gene_type:complete
LSHRDGTTTEKTVPLCHHWGGTTFPTVAYNFAVDFHERIRKAEKELGNTNCSDPITRLDPNTVLMQFLMWMGTQEEWKHYKYKGFFSNDLYLGCDLNDVDNSDNGNYEIWLPNENTKGLKTEVEMVREESYV